MSWLKLTIPNGRKVLVDLNNVFQINERDDGSQLVFSIVVPDQNSKMSARTLTVQETVDQIAKRLAAKSP